MNQIFHKKYFTDEQIIEYLNDMDNICIFSIADPETGFHYMSPVWPIFYQGSIFISTDDNTIRGTLVSKYENIKVGVTVIEPESYPNGRPGKPPYVSISGKGIIRRKEEFKPYSEVVDSLYSKFDNAFPTPESKEDWIDHVMNKSETRVLLEIKIEKCMIFEAFERATAEKKQNQEGN